jgi:hypothetical protein
MTNLGVFKEFLNRILKEALDPNYGLFQSTADGEIYPSTHKLSVEGTKGSQVFIAFQ